MSGTDLLATAQQLIDGAGPNEQVEVYAVRSRETEVKVFGGEVESLSVADVEGVGVRVIAGHRQGYAWAGSLDPVVIADTLVQARDNAAFAAVDEALGLPDAGDVASAPVPSLDLWRADLGAVPATDKVAIALEVERATNAADPRVRGVESASYGDSAIETAVVSSLGVVAQARRTVCSIGTVALAGDRDDTQTGYGFSVGRTFTELDVDSAAADAAMRATRLLGATQPPSQRIPVIFDPLVTRSVLALVGAALSGESIVKQRSMFLGRHGEAVAAPQVTVIDDPTNPEAFGAATHDGEGVPTRSTVLIDGGRLAGFLQNVYTARRSGTTTTGSAARGFTSTPGVGARALHLQPGHSSPEELLASVPEALYVQSVSGLHSGTSPVSGDFSVGAEGLFVRGGAFAAPVREVTIASTLPRMLLEVAGVGSDLTWLPGGAAGLTLLVGEMQMSGA